MMGYAKYIGRVGALATALGVGVATVVPVASAVDEPPPDSTALFVCGTTCPAFHDADVDLIMDQFIKPTHPDQTFTSVAVTTPSEAWPITGIFRLLEIAVGDPRLGGPGGAAWPDEPLWKLSGLFDLTGDQSIEQGVADLEEAMADNPDDHLVIYGYSQGAVVAGNERRKLAEQYPEGTEAPDIDFVLAGDVAVPNGGFGARFPGLYIPILDWTYEGAEPTDTQFDTTVITRQYDGFADFPLYPLNVIATLNAILGIAYVHSWPFDVSLADDTLTPIVSTDPSGSTTYYFYETENLPLFAPLRSLGVPEPLIDVVEPVFRVIVELGYDRSIPAWEPTPARLVPTTLDPAKVAGDLVDAIGEGVHNAAALFDVPAAPPAALTNTEQPSQTERSGSTGTTTDTELADTELTDTEQTDTNATSSQDDAEVTEAEEISRPLHLRHPARDSLGVTDQVRGFLHRIHRLATGGSAEESSSADSESSGTDSSGGDADGSN